MTTFEEDLEQLAKDIYGFVEKCRAREQTYIPGNRVVSWEESRILHPGLQEGYREVARQIAKHALKTSEMSRNHSGPTEAKPN